MKKTKFSGKELKAIAWHRRDRGGLARVVWKLENYVLLGLGVVTIAVSLWQLENELLITGCVMAAVGLFLIQYEISSSLLAKLARTVDIETPAIPDASKLSVYVRNFFLIIGAPLFFAFMALYIYNLFTR